MDWDQRYLNEDTPWDKGSAAPVLKHLLSERPVLFQNTSTALVPGCGIGHDAFLLANHGITTTGADISTTALQAAKDTHRHENLEWLQADLFNELPEASFDMVWEHTCFCAIPLDSRDAYVQAMADTIKPGGFLLGIFFIETDMPLDQGPPFKASIDTIKQHFFKHFNLEYQIAPTTSYPGREGKEHLMLFRRLNSCLD